ncbi:hypothetical protein Bca101_022981 [Brassica carinata]
MSSSHGRWLLSTGLPDSHTFSRPQMIAVVVNAVVLFQKKTNRCGGQVIRGY